MPIFIIVIILVVAVTLVHLIRNGNMAMEIYNNNVVLSIDNICCKSRDK